jgi:hypothetical protein
MANKVSFQFPNLHLLWSFARTLTSHNIEINTQIAVLTCDCSEENIKEAVARYRGVLIHHGL